VFFKDPKTFKKQSALSTQNDEVVVMLMGAESWDGRTLEISLAGS